MQNKNYGMGKNHPIAWYKPVGKGYTWYTSMGHDKAAWKNPNFTMMVENGIKWGNTH
jgi:type 1 glutamine amidotransferase